MARRSFSHLSLSQRRFVLLIIYAAIALPWIIHGAKLSMRPHANSPLDWVPQTFPARAAYNRFADAFGQGDVVVASWEGCQLDNVQLDALTETLRTAPPFFDDHGKWLFESVTSGREVFQTLTTAPLDLSAELARERLAGSFVGPDGRTTCMVVAFTADGVQQRRVLVERMEDAIHHFGGVPRSEIHLAGPVIDGVTVDVASKQTLTHLAIPSAVVVFALCHLALRSLRAATLVFAVSLYAQGVTLALIHYGGRELSALLIVMPPLMQVLAVAGGIHLINYYLEALHDPSITDPAMHALRVGWLPCLLSAATTAVGLGSLAISQLAPIRDFGVFAACGVVCTTALLLSAIPGTLSLWRWSPPRKAAKHAGDADRLSLGWSYLNLLVQTHHATIGVVTLVVLAALGAGLSRLNASVRIETLFAPDSRILRDYAWLESHLGPLVPIEIVLECDADCSLSLRQRLRIVQLIGQHATQTTVSPGATPAMPSSTTASVRSALSFLPEFPEPPYDAAPTAEIREELEGRYQAQIDAVLAAMRPQFRKLQCLHEQDGVEQWRVTTFVSATAPIDYGQYLQDLRRRVDPLLIDRDQQPLAGARLHYTGIMPLVHEIQRQLLDDLFSSFLSAFVIITLVMILLQGSVVAGLVSMVSNVFPAVLLFGSMGWWGGLMDIGTVMTASIALGIAVDDTLHFLTFFRQGLHEQLGQRGAVRFAYRHCGRAMVQSTVILTLGMLVFALSDFVPTRRFAWMMCGSLTAALFGDLVILPALLVGPLGWFFLDRRQDEAVAGEHGFGPADEREAIAIPIAQATLRVPRRSLDQRSFDRQSGAEAEDDAGQRTLLFTKSPQDEEYGR